jgi:hypothetical protein
MIGCEHQICRFFCAGRFQFAPVAVRPLRPACNLVNAGPGKQKPKHFLEGRLSLLPRAGELGVVPSKSTAKTMMTITIESGHEVPVPGLILLLRLDILESASRLGAR